MVPFRAATEPSGSAPAAMRERELLAAWREAHWSLQERLRELPAPDAHDVDALYQTARKADTELTALYQRRAEALARQVRDLLVQRVSVASTIAPAASVPTVGRAEASGGEAEAALLAWFRALPPEDRQTVTALAERLARR